MSSIKEERDYMAGVIKYIKLSGDYNNFQEFKKKGNRKTQGNHRVSNKGMENYQRKSIQKMMKIS